MVSWGITELRCNLTDNVPEVFYWIKVRERGGSYKRVNSREVLFYQTANVLINVVNLDT